MYNITYVNDLGGYSVRVYRSLQAALDGQLSMLKQGWWMPGPSVAIGKPLPGCE